MRGGPQPVPSLDGRRVRAPFPQTGLHSVEFGIFDPVHAEGRVDFQAGVRSDLLPDFLPLGHGPAEVMEQGIELAVWRHGLQLLPHGSSRPERLNLRCNPLHRRKQGVDRCVFLAPRVSECFPTQVAFLGNLAAPAAVLDEAVQ